ncbi:hypothetical protein ALQ16_203059 [Pseudomonas syringae pv. actinidiae]|uniref:Uncharacterized protein n=1 Tax=Pseudomonas syringae pv. actinidiae TaxID=103796 RepID=A0AAN4QCL0_PSESF|nr:hypothetical protein ALQ16_203059 [Pseudomonas syringae pv. actinidiae]GBH21534.1 hypothetical protein KPSA3_07582 [Pseudomonas syringae pv. actinidiae]
MQILCYEITGWESPNLCETNGAEDVQRSVVLKVDQEGVSET